MDLHLKCRPLAEISPVKQAKTQNETATVSPCVVSFSQGVSLSLSLSWQRQSPQVRERVVANLLGTAATASKRLAVMAAIPSERLAVTEAMSSK